MQAVKKKTTVMMAILGLLIVSLFLWGCSGDENDNGGGGNFPEQEPNDDPASAQILGDISSGDRFVITGSIANANDLDAYRFTVVGNQTFIATLTHDANVNFDLAFVDPQIEQFLRVCNAPTSPENCQFAPGNIVGQPALDILVRGTTGTGNYTLTIDSQ